MSIVLQEAQPPEDLRRCHPVMLELRPHFTDADEFVAQVMRQQREGGYRVFFTERAESVCAVAGFRVIESLSWGRFLYVDDLVTAVAARKQGHARVLLDAIIAETRRLGCGQVHLDSGVQRFDAHRLYLNAGMRISCHHFAMDL